MGGSNREPTSLNKLFQGLGDVIPEAQSLVTAGPRDRVGEVLKQMSEGGFGQVPIILESGEVLGVFSYRSFAQRLRMFLGAKAPDVPAAMEMPVEDFLEEIAITHAGVGVDKVLDEFDSKDAVLVGSADRLEGIVTSVDALRYFVAFASPFVLLQSIELAVRRLIAASVDDGQLRECISACIAKHYEEEDRAPPARIDELTLSDCVNLLHYQKAWPFFERAFGQNQLFAYSNLDPLKDVRNAVFHHRRTLADAELRALRDCRDWLLRRIKTLDASKKT
jgi:CBS domain-containing protein